MSIHWRVDRSLINQPFAADIDELLASDPANWYVTFGYRTRDTQQVLYDKFLKGGPRAAPPGESAHEYGLAVDVTLVKNGEDNWNYLDESWRRLVEKVTRHPRLHSLDILGDTDHIEAVGWRSLAHRVEA